MSKTGKRRYICSYLYKDEEGELKPNVVVVAAFNPIDARTELCRKYGVPNRNTNNNKEEGVKSIRQAETNVFEGETENENFYNGNNT